MVGGGQEGSERLKGQEGGVEPKENDLRTSKTSRRVRGRTSERQ